MGAGSFWCCAAKGKEATGKTAIQEVPLEHEKEIPYFLGDRTL